MFRRACCEGWNKELGSPLLTVHYTAPALHCTSQHSGQDRRNPEGRGVNGPPFFLSKTCSFKWTSIVYYRQIKNQKIKYSIKIRIYPLQSFGPSVVPGQIGEGGGGSGVTDRWTWPFTINKNLCCYCWTAGKVVTVVEFQARSSKIRYLFLHKRKEKPH